MNRPIMELENKGGLKIAGGGKTDDCINHLKSHRFLVVFILFTYVCIKYILYQVISCSDILFGTCVCDIGPPPPSLCHDKVKS
jgi:hypothetical protein